MIKNMHELNINGVDLNLLPPLLALLRRCNVTHAASDAGLSQPAMSRALARLRALLGDALLVRGNRGYVLTPRAAALLPLLETTLGGVRALLAPAAFDPAVAVRTIRLAATDSHAVLLLPAVLARLAAAAPGIDLRVEGYGPELIARIERGDLDLAFATSATPLPPGAVSAPPTRDRLALVRRRGHPAPANDWTLADYGRWPHVGISLLGDGASDLDARLAAAGVRRRFALVTPYFTAALAAVGGSDCVTTLSARFAEFYADRFDLLVKPPPFADSDININIVWSDLRNGDPVLAWFRALLTEVAVALNQDES